MTAQWPGICENLKKSLDSGVFKVWIAPLEGSVEHNVVNLTAPSAFVANWVRDRLGDVLRQSAAPVLGLAASAIELNVRVASASERPSPPAPTRVVEEPVHSASALPPACDHITRTPESPAIPAQGQLPLRSAAPGPLRWRYHFDDFVVGPTNAVAVAAAQDICRPASSVDTLFVSADSGLGKTHLIHAIGQCLYREQGHARVGYLTAEDFTTRFIMGMRSGQMDNFKAGLRDLDVLLLDDVHFFQGKEKTQEEALATIKSLQARGSRVVLTSSFTPRELSNVDSQLVSYFCSGLLANMERPSLDMRRHILSRKARLHQVILPDAVADLLARQCSTDVRQLESCLNNLIFKARHLNRQICLELAMDVLGQFASVESVLDVEHIINMVCDSYGLSFRQLASRSRRQECVLARNTVYYLARKHTELSLQEIGEKFNRRHSTVIKGITSIERELQRESTVGRQVAKAVQLIERNAGIRASM